ncbi:CU044_5270 family protein [Nonomuraea sp. LP-02]|uniref:CU044_5270 family protein n=1 Tax=Nonomuraea sp. LP-02 TaxID=3097960 RepID=UPI002E2EC311|nr:CU044_5270 family protein [Nonomuraea sp. LP-02]MED7931290.1 CU044_5270 family protein [Nonomuraea sp. LP-02]
MSTIKDFRRDTPPMTAQAENAARARLLAAARGPEPRRAPRPVRRLGRQAALAGALAVAIGTGVVVARDQPHVVQVANVRELGERAAQAAYDDHGQVPGPGQWLYIRERQAPQSGDGGYGVDVSRRVVWEQWTSVDGKQVAAMVNGKLLVQGNHPGLGAADLARQPITPEGVLARIRQSLEDMHMVWGGSEPPPSMDERLFQAVYQLMGTQALPPEVRAALFRGLATIPGVSFTEDVVDADGRRGVAFSHTGHWARYDLILDPVDFHFLGTYGVQTTEYDDPSSSVIKAGTPLTLTARLDAKVVDGPGRR